MVKKMVVMVTVINNCEFHGIGMIVVKVAMIFVIIGGISNC